MDKKLSFIEYYFSCEIAEKKRIRTGFLKETGLSHPAFYTKLRRRNFTLLERRLVEDICNKTFIWQ